MQYGNTCPDWGCCCDHGRECCAGAAAGGGNLERLTGEGRGCKQLPLCRTCPASTGRVAPFCPGRCPYESARV